MNLTSVGSAVVLGFLALLGGTIIYLIWTGRIDLTRVISEPNGDASMSRLQLLIFTFVIAASLFLITASPCVDKPCPAFPDNIPPGVLLLLGISSSSYLVSKGIQFGSDQGVPVVAITPAVVQAKLKGPGVQFTAAVDRASEQKVVWSLETPNSGTISTSGMYTPPDSAPAGVALPIIVTVRATSVADATSSATATIVLT